MGMLLGLRMMVTNELSCYTINSDVCDGCHVCFVAHENAAGENGHRLDGTIIYIMNVFKSVIKNCSMWCLYHHNHGHVYARVVNDNNSTGNNQQTVQAMADSEAGISA